MISVRIRISTRIVRVRHPHTHIRILLMAEVFTSPSGSVNALAKISEMPTFQNEKAGSRTEGLKQRLGSRGGGGEPSPHQLGGLGSAVNSPSKVRGRAATTTQFLLYLKCSGGLSCSEL